MDSRFAPLCASLLFAVGCDDPTEGDRARLNRCPTDEICSARHQQGLKFLPRWGPDTAAVAVDGTWTLRLKPAGGSGEALSGFDASVEGPVFDVEVLDSQSLRITGRSAGEAYLRILERSSGRLIDRLSVRVDEAVSTRLGRSSVVAGGSIAVPDTALELAVELLATDGTQLIDDGVAATVEGLPSETHWWSTGAGFPFHSEGAFGTTVKIPPRSAGATLHLTAGGQVTELSLVPQEPPDAIAPISRVDSVFQFDGPHEEAGVGQMTQGTVSKQCWSAFRDGVPLTTVPLTFQTSPHLSFEQVGPCVRLATAHGVPSGEAQIVVSAGGLERRFHVAIVGSPAP